MAAELIKNFEKIREYMREFYVNGFRSREDFTGKSMRTYDDERRRIESWLGEYLSFNRENGAKVNFISVDCRTTQHNPLYRAWKTKSFTERDIALHFYIFDLLDTPDKEMTLEEILDGIDGYLENFENGLFADESTVRKKLKEYVGEGIIETRKDGKKKLYRRGAGVAPTCCDTLDFYSEVAPCGVIGSFLLDKTDRHRPHFLFRHHYITATTDSGIVCDLFEAMREHREVTVESVSGKTKKTFTQMVIPVKIVMSVQGGREYLMAYSPQYRSISSFRIDLIKKVTAGDVCPDFDRHRGAFKAMSPHIWGVGMRSRAGANLDHIDFTVTFGENETAVYERLLREKRSGTVTRLDDTHAKFSIDVFDAVELFPWIRTFIGRITELNCSDEGIKKQFCDDLAATAALYGHTEGGDNDAVQ